MLYVAREVGWSARSLSLVLDWLTVFRSYSKDAVADEMAVNDVYVLQVNVYTLCKAKGGDVEDVTLPRARTPARETLL